MPGSFSSFMQMLTDGQTDGRTPDMSDDLFNKLSLIHRSNVLDSNNSESVERLERLGAKLFCLPVPPGLYLCCYSAGPGRRLAEGAWVTTVQVHNKNQCLYTYTRGGVVMGFTSHIGGAHPAQTLHKVSGRHFHKLSTRELATDMWSNVGWYYTVHVWNEIPYPDGTRVEAVLEGV